MWPFLLLVAAAAAEDDVRRLPISMLPPAMRGGRLAKERFEDTSYPGTVHRIELPLDHFNTSVTSKISIRYFTNNSLFDSQKGPIFVSMGGEGPTSGVRCSSRAQELSALCVAVEHRFYGDSLPAGGLTEANMKYLSVEQNLADTAAIIDAVRSSIGDASRSVVNFGGSYSGATCAWFRLRYPSKSRGCVSESGVVNALLDFTAFDSHVYTALETYEPSCAANLVEATRAMERFFANGQAEDVKSIFNASSYATPGFAETDFFYMIADQPAMMVQYGSKEALCKGLRKLPVSPTDDQRLKNLNSILVEHYGPGFAQNCFYDSNCVRNDRGSEGMARSWRWQKCSEIAYLQPAPPKNSLRAKVLTIEALIDQCHYMFPEALSELPKPATLVFNEKFGGAHPAYEGKEGSNIFFLNYSDDPWMEASTVKAFPGMPYCLTTCNDCGHCGAGVTDSEGRHCQDEATRSMKQWLDAERQVVV